jgi:hypothetical protein
MPMTNTIRLDQTLEKISSENVEKRREGWRELHDCCTEFRKHLNDAQLKYLRNLFSEEKDSIVFRLALKALLALAMQPSGVIVGSERTDAARTKIVQDAAESRMLLANWLWGPFGHPSAVLGVTATNYRRRDEGALLWIGRRLSFPEYGQTEFPQVSVENPDLDRLLFEGRYHAFCVVGRLGLFGKSALQRLSSDNSHFGFAMHHRPKDLPPGELDAEYHCVLEQIGGCRQKSHCTEEKDGFRTDFAVVHRYRVELGTRHVVVVVVSGASSLGTCAAAQWAAYDLFRPTDTIEKSPIEVPPGITPNSRLEALLSARAKVTTSAWEHPEIDVLKLNVDDYSWSLADRQWHLATIEVVTVVRRKGKPIQILFNGRPAKLEPGKQMFRLMVAIAEQVRKHGSGKLDIAALAANKEVWENPNPAEDYVRTQLRQLRTRYLKEALDMRGTLEFRAEVNEIIKS